MSHAPYCTAKCNNAFSNSSTGASNGVDDDIEVDAVVDDDVNGKGGDDDETDDAAADDDEKPGSADANADTLSARKASSSAGLNCVDCAAPILISTFACLFACLRVFSRRSV
jgi:hypothetical protein